MLVVEAARDQTNILGILVTRPAEKIDEIDRKRP